MNFDDLIVGSVWDDGLNRPYQIIYNDGNFVHGKYLPQNLTGYFTCTSERFKNYLDRGRNPILIYSAIADIICDKCKIFCRQQC